MTSRSDVIARFLRHHGWEHARQRPLAGDASLRRYIRLLDGPRPALLMDAPPETGEDVRPFLKIGSVLQDRGISVPEILAADEDLGLLILEDLGEGLFAKVARESPEQEVELYVAAAEALAQLQVAPPPADIPAYTPLMADLAGLSLDWYAPEGLARRADLVAAVERALTHDAMALDALVHRDFHADNLIWLPDRAGVARVGMIDFQDAMRGPAEYDIASLVHDPRRPVSDEARVAATQVFAQATGRPRDLVDAGIAITSAQRCLRILGVFARLCLRDGKAHYPDFIPSTWRALQRDLAHPALAEVREVVDATLPEPTADRLAEIRAGLGTFAGRLDARLAP